MKTVITMLAGLLLVLPSSQQESPAAAAQARFTPATIAGKPATVDGVIVYRYVYPGGPR